MLSYTLPRRCHGVRVARGLIVVGNAEVVTVRVMPRAEPPEAYRATYKVPEAIAAIARATGTIQERLVAGANELAMLDLGGESDLPAELRDEFRALFATLTVAEPITVGPGGARFEGKIEATCLRMSAEQAQAAIDRILGFQMSLDEIRERQWDAYTDHLESRARPTRKH